MGDLLAFMPLEKHKTFKMRLLSASQREGFSSDTIKTHYIMYNKSSSEKNLVAFVAKAWEKGVELNLKPEQKEVIIYSGAHKFETIKITTEMEVDALVEYVSEEKEDSNEANS